MKKKLACLTVPALMLFLAGGSLTVAQNNPAAAGNPGKTQPNNEPARQAATSGPKSGQKAAPTAPPTAQEIAGAKAKGLVWVNTSTKVYHKDGTSYGTTKRGKFMTEDEATKAGFRAAKEPTKSKKAAAHP